MSEIVIMLGGKKHPQIPIVADDITWKTERRGSPGELNFTVIKDQPLGFHEGDPVKMSVDGKDVFYGFVFTKSRDKDHHIKVTCYDQLRYLKNKDTMVYEQLKCADVIKKIAGAFGLEYGELADTGHYVDDSQDDSTLFDIIQSNLDDVVRNTGKMFVLYDDVGKLILKDIEDMAVEYLIHDKNIENFDYKSTIDEGVYNKVKVIVDNTEASTRDIYIAKDTKHINQWGLLQLTEKMDGGTTEANAKLKCDILIELHNRTGRTLKVNGAVGDTRVRGGCLLPVHLYLGDISAQNWLIVDSVTHKWSKGHYSMDIQLIGGGKFS